MRVLLFGASGFIGHHVASELTAAHDVFIAGRNSPAAPNSYEIDLLNNAMLGDLLKEVRPEGIINCAGIVDASQDFSLNNKFTENILSAVAHSGLDLKKIVICGSASVYGTVLAADLPVKESLEPSPTSDYGKSKLLEEQTAMAYFQNENLPVVIARIFNPVGVGMGDKFLISRILAQIADVNAGIRDSVEVSRLDSERDYLSAGDVASALVSLLESGEPGEVYNVGSGISTTNRQLARLILDAIKIDSGIEVRQTSLEPEPIVASQADISKIIKATGWHPKEELQPVIKEIVNAANQTRQD